MKKIFTIVLVALTISIYPQCTTSISPASASVNCFNGASPVSFTATYSQPSVTVVHEWWSPVNPMPLGVPMYTAGTITSVLTASLAPGIYTVVTLDLTNSCGDTVIFSVTSSFAFPKYNLSSPTNFSLGCSNQTTLNIVNPVSTQTPPATCSYSFLAPTFTGVVNPTIALSPIASRTIGMQGTWTVIVQDNNNFCRNIVPVMMGMDTLSPDVYAMVSTQTLTCFTPTVIATGTSTTPNTSISWIVPGTPSNISTSTVFVGGPPTGPGTSTASLVYADFTVVATNTLSGCQGASIVSFSQNFKPPSAAPTLAPGSPTSASCSTLNPVVLTIGNSSCTSGIPPGNMYVCWIDPVSQNSACGTFTDQVTAPGLYTLALQDSQNGCWKTGTINVPGLGIPNASFMHTVEAGGNVNFNNTTPLTGTFATNWNYGDGHIGSGNFSSHTFASAGAFPVSMTITSAGCTGTVVQSVNVTGIPCVADASFSLAPTYTPQYWTATPNYPWNIVGAEWDWGDGGVSDTLYTSHNYTSPGTYSICLTVTTSCGGAASACVNQYVYKASQQNALVHVNVMPPMIITVKESEIMENIYSIYPNPGAGEFNISINRGGEKLEVKVFDVFGNMIEEKNYDNTGKGLNADLDLRTSPSGIYFIRISNGQKEYVKKIIINH
jgi:PKD repeat protein